MTRSVGKGLLYAAGLAVVVGVAAPFLIPLLFGDDFEPAWKPLALLLPGVVVYGPVTILVVYLSVRHARPNLSLAVAVAAAAVTAGLSLVFIPRYGAEGAAVASTIGYAVGATLAWLLFRRVARRAVQLVALSQQPLSSFTGADGTVDRTAYDDEETS